MGKRLYETHDGLYWGDLCTEYLGASLMNIRETLGSHNVEWYTPEKYLLKARAVLGTIDLDHASSPQAQETVQATQYYTAADDGLVNDWYGRVWLNPPYAAGLIGSFAAKMAAEYQNGNVTEAIMLTNNSTDTRWFQELAACSSAMCFTRGRIKFRSKDGSTHNSPPTGQTFFYFGTHAQTFAETFRDVGMILRE